MTPFKKFIENNYQIPEKRKLGKPLPETEYKEKYVKIYRATHHTITTFKNMDYITLSRIFAKEHAIHMASVEEENYHVITKIVPSSNIYEAYNPGEYFYHGPEIKGTIVFIANHKEL